MPTLQATVLNLADWLDFGIYEKKKFLPTLQVTLGFFVKPTLQAVWTWVFIFTHYPLFR